MEEKKVQLSEQEQRERTIRAWQEFESILAPIQQTGELHGFVKGPNQ